MALLTYIQKKFKHDKIVEEKVTICGWKINIFDIRKDLLQSQFQYMRLQSDEELEALKHEDTVKFFTRIHEYYTDALTKSSQELLQKMKTFQRTCNLIFCHDRSTLSSHGYILIMVATLYDDTAFMSTKEYFKLTGISTEIQPITEKLYLCKLTRCPSTEQQLIYRYFKFKRLPDNKRWHYNI